MTNIILILLTQMFVTSLGLYVLYVLLRRRISPKSGEGESRLDLSNLEAAINKLPARVLNSISSSANNKKGNLGELIAYIQLKAEYDRIFAVNNIIDLVCIRFPTKDKPGTVDFVEVKSTDKSRTRLTKHQASLRELLKNKQVRFVKYQANFSICS